SAAGRDPETGTADSGAQGVGGSSAGTWEQAPMQPDDVARVLAPKLGENLLGVEPFEGMAGRVRFRREGALDLFRAVRDDLAFAHLSMVGGIDWVDHREAFYVAWSDVHRQYVLLSTDVPATARTWRPPPLSGRARTGTSARP